VEIDPNKKQNQDIIVGTKTVNPEESELILNGKIRQLKTDHKIEIK
jgi:cytidylate kinase